MSDNLTSSFLAGFEGKKATVKKSDDVAKKPKTRKGQYSRPGSEDRLYGAPKGA